MKALANLLPVLLVCLILALDTAEAGSRRQDALKAFQPLKASSNGKPQQRKLISGASELFVSLQSELILTQEPYVQQTIDEEAKLQKKLAEPSINADCGQFVNSRTDLIVQLAGLSLRNCVAKIDDEMFARFYPSQNSDDSLREKYDKASLLSSFRDENIFVEPLTIESRIKSKLNDAVTVEGLVVSSEQAAALRSAFQDCLTKARELMKESLHIGASQVDVVCAN